MNRGFLGEQVNDTIWAVMVPIQKDGGGGWIDPEIAAWFATEADARDWVRQWATNHVGFATVYRCDKIADVSLPSEAELTHSSVSAVAGAADAPQHAITLDADALITLAQFPQNLSMTRAIHASVKDGRNDLWLPQPIIDAYHRRKQDAIDRYWQAERTALKTMRARLKAYAPDSSEFDTVADAIKKNLDQGAGQVPECVAAVDALVADATSVAPKADQERRAFNRLREAKAPAEKVARSSANDCLIWEMVSEEAMTRSVTFVTNNSSDFGNGTLLPNLKAEVEKAKICYHNLDNFREHHIKGVKQPVVLADPAASLPLPYEGQSCPRCKAGVGVPVLAGGQWHIRCSNGCGFVLPTGEYFD